MNDQNKATEEIPVVFSCENSELIGIVHRPDASKKIGLLIIVGGPQYRVGSHRQFLLLSRYLTEHGYPVMRFDYRGMGDSDGLEADFERCETDIKVAIDTFYKSVESLHGVVIWGLCDAASAGLFYSYRDERVVGLVLLNPWVRTESGLADAYLKHYYSRRILDKDFWLKVFSGRWNLMRSLNSFIGLMKTSSLNKPKNKVAAESRPDNLPERMALGLEKFTGPVLFILSGNNDYVADEFRDVVKSSKRWKKLIKRNTVEVINLLEANHTFSSAKWRNQVENRTFQWLEKLKI